MMVAINKWNIRFNISILVVMNSPGFLVLSESQQRILPLLNELFRLISILVAFNYPDFLVISDYMMNSAIIK